MSLSPATRQTIINQVHRFGHYRAHHGGILMEIESQQINGKWCVVLKVCVDRKWKDTPCENVFAAVEEFNRWSEYERYRREQVEQTTLELQ